MASFKQIKAVLIDLSGTLHIENTVTPNALTALKKLRSSGLKLRFVTNTTKEPLRLLHDRLQQLGFDIQKQEIFTSLTSAASLIQEKKLRPYLLVEDSAKEDFHNLNVEDPNAVVIGLAPQYFNYEDMNKAFQLLLNGATLIAIHKARYYKKTDGLYLGPGPFVTGLEFATNTTAHVVGKPEQQFFLAAVKGLDVEPSEVVMVGDDAKDDVEGAIKAGMRGILVKTGKYRPSDEERIETGPVTVTDTFSDAVDLLLSHQN